MKAQKINSRNFNTGNRSTDQLPVSAKFYNDLHEDVEFLYPLRNQFFKGTISLEKALTHYLSYTVNTDVAISASKTKQIGAYAELTLVANGSNTPAFSADFTITPSSDVWDTTQGKIHKVGVYYDGTYVFYTLTIIN